MTYERNLPRPIKADILPSRSNDQLDRADRSVELKWSMRIDMDSKPSDSASLSVDRTGLRGVGSIGYRSVDLRTWNNNIDSFNIQMISLISGKIIREQCYSTNLEGR
jgi:hypothetical protein